MMRSSSGLSLKFLAIPRVSSLGSGCR